MCAHVAVTDDFIPEHLCADEQLCHCPYCTNMLSCAHAELQMLIDVLSFTDYWIHPHMH